MREKKWLSLTLALAMTASLTVPAMAAAPADVVGTWCEKEVSLLMDKGIVGGYSDGTYRPSTAVTRGAVAKMLLLTMRAAGSTIFESTVNSPFADTKGTWSEQFITPLTSLGIINAADYPNGFGQGENMSRLETIKVLVRAYLYANQNAALPTNATLDFTDANLISEADAPYVKLGIDLGIINGYSDGSFKPNASIQRSTAAAMMARTIDKLGTINDNIPVIEHATGFGKPGVNRVDTPIASKPQNQVQANNVEWVIDPQFVIPESNSTRFDFINKETILKTPDGCYLIDLKTNTSHFYKGIVIKDKFVFDVAVAIDLATGKMGYINIAGDWVIEPQFSNAGNFRMFYFKDGTQEVMGLATKDGIDYLLKNDKKTLVEEPADFWDKATDEVLFPPSCKYEVVSSECSDNGCWIISAKDGFYTYFGFCDTNGKVIIDPLGGKHYEGSYILSDGIILSRKASGATWDVAQLDVYTEDGKLVNTFYRGSAQTEFTPYHNVDTNEYGQGLLPKADTLGGKWGYMTKEGKEIIPCIFDNVEGFQEGFAWVQYQGIWGIIKLPNNF